MLKNKKLILMLIEGMKMFKNNKWISTMLKINITIAVMLGWGIVLYYVYWNAHLQLDNVSVLIGIMFGFILNNILKK